MSSTAGVNLEKNSADTRDSDAMAAAMPRPQAARRSRTVSLVAGSEYACSELERGLSARGVPYIVGGWSSEARRELAVQAGEFSLTLLFAHRGSCEYIADVNVRVTNERGEELVTLEEAGPIVLFGLGPGSYQVTVTRNGQALARTIAVGPRTRRQTVFYWSGF